MENIILSKEDFENFKQINLEIRHRITELQTALPKASLKRYLDFFKYAENIEKRILFDDTKENKINKIDRKQVENW